MSLPPSTPPPPALPPSLSSVRIPNLPDSAYYIPSFLTPPEESQLLHKVLSAPQPTWRHLSHRRLQAHPSPLTSSNVLLDVAGKGLADWLREPVIRRLQSIPVEPPTIDESVEDATGVGKESGDLTDHHNRDSAKEKRNDIFAPSPHGAPNHCLINEYTPGQGIHPHEDGDAYFPVVCTVSLGAHTVLDVRRKGEGEPHSHHSGGWRILQEPRSLLITTEEMYTECLHGIAGVEVDEGLNDEEVVNWGLLGDRGQYAEGWKRRGTRISLTYRDVVRVKKVGKAFGGLMR